MTASFYSSSLVFTHLNTYDSFLLTLFTNYITSNDYRLTVARFYYKIRATSKFSRDYFRLTCRIGWIVNSDNENVWITCLIHTNFEWVSYEYSYVTHPDFVLLGHSMSGCACTLHVYTCSLRPPSSSGFFAIVSNREISIIDHSRLAIEEQQGAFTLVSGNRTIFRLQFMK